LGIITSINLGFDQGQIAFKFLKKMIVHYKIVQTAIACALLCLYVSCKKDVGHIKPSESPEEIISVSPATKILILKVDYVTKSFKGGTEIALAPHSFTADSLPIAESYVPPADFGRLSLIYAPTSDTLFNGTIIWMGSGAEKIPSQLSPATSFAKMNSSVALPSASRFQQLHRTFPASRDTIPWDAIKNLSVVNQYVSGNTKKIGYFLYTPSVGIGNPLEWNWFFYISN
jgi:hypothetical protein